MPIIPNIGNNTEIFVGANVQEIYAARAFQLLFDGHAGKVRDLGLAGAYAVKFRGIDTIDANVRVLPKKRVHLRNLDRKRVGIVTSFKFNAMKRFRFMLAIAPRGQCRNSRGEDV